MSKQAVVNSVLGKLISPDKRDKIKAQKLYDEFHHKACDHEDLVWRIVENIYLRNSLI